METLLGSEKESDSAVSNCLDLDFRDGLGRHIVFSSQLCIAKTVRRLFLGECSGGGVSG